MLKVIGNILMICGAIAAASGIISGIGFFLYNWGANDMAVGASAWAGFVVTVKMWIGGISSAIIGLLMSVTGD